MPHRNFADGDHVDRVREQWREQLPELDTTPVAVIARLGRVVNYVDNELESFFARHGLTRTRWDILASLRRSGPPYRLSPTALYRGLMRSSGGLTHQLKVLERDGLIRRVADPGDQRGLLVALTPRGRSLTERVAAEHVQNESRLLSALSERQQEQLAGLLRRLLLAYEAELPAPGQRDRSS